MSSSILPARDFCGLVLGMDFAMALHYAGHVFFSRLRSRAFHCFPPFARVQAGVDWKGMPIVRLRIPLLEVAILLLVCPFHSAISEDAVPSKPAYETPGPVNAEDFLPKSAFAGTKRAWQNWARNLIS